jgi:hypothetical protein
MRIRLLRETLMAVAVLSTAPANGAEIVLEQSAVQKLVAESLFKDNGRYYIQRGACSAYLDSPTVTLTGGRVVIRSRLNARVGMDFGDSCAGVDLVSWTTVSGEPSAQGTSVRLANIRIEEVGDANTRIVLNSGLVPTLPGALELDVLKGVRSMLQGASGQLQVEVLALDIESVRIADNKLSVRFDFRVAGR